MISLSFEPQAVLAALAELIGHTSVAIDRPKPRSLEKLGIAV